MMKNVFWCVVAVFVIFLLACDTQAQIVVQTSPGKVVVQAEAAQVAPVLRYRYVRPWLAVPAPIVVAQKPVQAFAVVEEAKSPYLVRGIFTDRVRLPRGTTKTIVPVQ